MTRGEAGGRGPDGLIAVRVSDREILEQAVTLGDLNKRTLGFLPHKAYEQAAAAGTLLTVVDHGRIWRTPFIPASAGCPADSSMRK